MPTLATTLGTPGEHIQPLEWLFVVGALALALGVTAALGAAGRSRERNPLLHLFDRYSNALTWATGLPGWAASGILLALWGQLTAMVGLFWDVSWHIDLGRDRELFTPPHTLILLGLGALLAAAVVSIAFATVEEERSGFRVGPLRVPYSSATLFLLSMGGVIGFPLDDFWHRTYGVDVTLWSPTHLLMIGSAVLSTVASNLMFAEARRGRELRRWGKLLPRAQAGTVLGGISVFMLEFDLGVPQFQQLYQPVVIALAAGMGLTVGRAILGRGGAIRIALGYLGIRTALALLMGGLGHDVPHFPIFVVEAALVEFAFTAAERRGPVTQALFAGALVGTLGLAAEWAWMAVWGRHPWTISLFPGIWAAVLVAVPAAVIGTAMGRVLALERARIPALAVALALLAVVGLLLVPLPREGTPGTVTLRTSPAGQAVDLPGQPAAVNVSATVQPSNLASGADWFELLSWQGGGFQQSPMVETGPGRYQSTRPVPVGGNWKSILRLAHNQVLASVPVYMPPDLLLRAPAVQVVGEKSASFVPEQHVLLRETHAGPAWPRTLAYALIASLTLLWFGTLALAFRAVSIGVAGPGAPRRPRPARLVPRPAGA